MNTAITSLDNIDSFIKEIDVAQNLDAILEALRTQIDRLGFEQFCYWLIWPKEGPRIPLYLTSYPASWSEHYIQENFKSRDMVGLHSAITFRPFTWTQLKQEYQLSKEQKVVFNDGIDIGFRSGGSIPLHGPRDAKAALSVTNNCSDEEFNKLFVAQRHELHLIASYVHEKVMSLGLDQPVPFGVRLTAREIEILTWAARGKTRWEIGEILNISEETVKKHGSNACAKLNAANKTHAIAIAMINGLILP